MFKITKCKDKALYSAKLDKQAKLDLKKIAKAFPPKETTPILLLLEIENCEIIVHRHGEVMFKNCKDISKMKKIATKIYKKGL